MKYLNYLLIIVGAFVAMYGKNDVDENQFALIGGIVILMIGVYRVSRTIPSKNSNEEGFNEDEND